MKEVIIMSFAFENTHCICLGCMLVPGQTENTNVIYGWIVLFGHCVVMIPTLISGSAKCREIKENTKSLQKHR